MREKFLQPNVEVTAISEHLCFDDRVYERRRDPRKLR